MRGSHLYTKQYYQSEFSSIPQLKQFDWRLDIKIQSKNEERMKKPTLYMKMDIGNSDKEQKSVLFEMSKEQLKDVLANFEAINN